MHRRNTPPRWLHSPRSMPLTLWALNPSPVFRPGLGKIKVLLDDGATLTMSRRSKK
jgi:hypothetical protein